MTTDSTPAPAVLHVVVGGGSGFLSTHLIKRLRDRGHRVTRLVRRPAEQHDESTWDPAAGAVDRELIADADVVVNLAGSPLVGNVHSDKWAREVRESRVTSTATLANAIAAADTPPAFLAGNGISYYGDHRDTPLSETADTRGSALLTEVARDWQAAAQPAQDAGARVCILRTAPVMDRQSPPLKQLRLLFLTGLGGRLGTGQQRMAMISLRDWVGGVVHLAEHDSAAGPFNLCCPQTPTNADFTQALARSVRRPAFAFVPGPVLRVAAGKMAPELLGSLNVEPAALVASGYVFRDRGVDDVLAAALA